MNFPVVFIFITVVIDAMGIGLILPVMPDLLREITGSDLADAALWGGVLSTIFAVMQFFFAPMLGNLSDRFGRRPILLVSLLVLSLDYLVMAVAGSIWLLLLARVVAGISAATQSAASAYMADISPPEKKAANFGLIGAAFGLGFVAGPVIGGLLAEFGTRAPFYAAAVLTGGHFILGYFLLRETVTEQNRRPFEWRRANPFGALKVLSRIPGLRRGLLIFFLYQVAINVYPNTWPYFGRERFDWSPGMVGLSLGLFGIMMAIVQGVLIRLFLKWLGERGTVIYGLCFELWACTMLVIVSSGTLALILTPLAALGAVVTPALQGIMSKAVDDNQQGELQGALTSVGALAMMISPTLHTTTFATFTAPEAPIYLPGAAFVLAGALILLTLFVFLAPSKSAVTSR